MGTPKSSTCARIWTLAGAVKTEPSNGLRRRVPRVEREKVTFPVWKSCPKTAISYVFPSMAINVSLLEAAQLSVLVMGTRLAKAVPVKTASLLAVAAEFTDRITAPETGAFQDHQSEPLA